MTKVSQFPDLDSKQPTAPAAAKAIQRESVNASQDTGSVTLAMDGNGAPIFSERAS